MTLWESYGCIVPQNSAPLAEETKLSNVSEGKAAKPTRGSKRTAVVHSDDPPPSHLDRITQRAERDRAAKFNNLYSALTIDHLYGAYCQLKRGKAPGVDEVTVEEYGEKLSENLRTLHTRLHHQTYRPQPSLRCEIPKGNGKTRPLGIACVEDKLVQRAVVAVLERIYEVDFMSISYGFRPALSCHQALSHLDAIISQRPINWISDADIKGFFDNVSHRQLMELLQKRITDPRMLWLIERFLEAGVMIDGKLFASDGGVPQGSCLSPLLANVYLHYVLDRWYEDDVKPRMAGAAYMVRYADDFICAFQVERDAQRFQEVLSKRLGRFSLELATDKTKLIRFGRYAARDSQRVGAGAPSTFDFLGFTHYCGLSRKGKFKLKRCTAKKKFRQKVAALKGWFRANLTTPITEVWPKLNSKLQGHYQYYNVNDNWRSLIKFREAARRMGLRWMRRRSHKGATTSWADYHRHLRLYPLADPGQITDLIALARTI